MTATAGDVIITGTVDGNVTSLSGDVTLADTAVVGGTVLATTGDVYRAGGAQIQKEVTAPTGSVRESTPATAHDSGGGFFGFLWRLLTTLFGSALLLVLGGVVMVVAPRPPRAWPPPWNMPWRPARSSAC